MRANYDCHCGDKEKPIGEEDHEEPCHNADDAYYVSVVGRAFGPVVRSNEGGCLVGQRDKSCGGITCTLLGPCVHAFLLDDNLPAGPTDTYMPGRVEGDGRFPVIKRCMYIAYIRNETTQATP